MQYRGMNEKLRVYYGGRQAGKQSQGRGHTREWKSKIVVGENTEVMVEFRKLKKYKEQIKTKTNTILR